MSSPIVWFPHKGASTRRRLTWKEFVEVVQNPPIFAGHKDNNAMVTLAEFDGCGTQKVNVIANHGVLLDFDQPSDDPDGLVLRISSALCVGLIAHSSISSKEGAVKTHAFVLYDEPCSPAEHESSWFVVDRLLRRAGIEADKACKDCSRRFYAPGRRPGGVYWYAIVDGPSWPAKRAAQFGARLQAPPAPRSRPRLVRSSLKSARRYLAKCEPAIQGANGSRATFVAALKLFGLGLNDDEVFELMTAEYNCRCVPPWSERELRKKVLDASKFSKKGAA